MSSVTCSNSQLNNLYSTSSIDSSQSTKDSSVKLPYPVLADHRHPPTVLVLLQGETQTTSKKILDVNKQINEIEKRLSTNFLSDRHGQTLKFQRIQRKQQLDALKKHERRVNLQIDYITTKIEIQNLGDELTQMNDKKTSDEYKQIEILVRKLKQKLDQMKIYMRTRNEQMKKEGQEKKSSSQDNRNLSLSTGNHQSNKHLKTHSKFPAVRLVKSHPKQTPTVRFLNKTTDSTTMNSVSPTTPASSSSTLSPPLIATTSTEHIHQQVKSSTSVFSRFFFFFFVCRIKLRQCSKMEKSIPNSISMNYSLMIHRNPKTYITQ